MAPENDGAEEDDLLTWSHHHNNAETVEDDVLRDACRSALDEEGRPWNVVSFVFGFRVKGQDISTLLERDRSARAEKLSAEEQKRQAVLEKMKVADEKRMRPGTATKRAGGGFVLSFDGAVSTARSVGQPKAALAAEQPRGWRLWLGYGERAT